MSLILFNNLPQNTLSLEFTHNISTWRFSIDQEVYLQENLNIKYFNGSADCNYCNFKVRNGKSNSSPRDLIITGSTNQVENINLFMRTLRHTGCMCTVAILVDKKAFKKINYEMIKDIERCGGQIINMGEPEFNMPFSYYSLIYLWNFYVAKRNFFQFDRIMKCDMFDTLFQGDPFNDEIEPGNFYMIEESPPTPYPYKYPGYKKIIRNLKMNISEKVNCSNVCAGISFGYTESFTRALDLFFSYFVWDKQWEDQHLFNVMYMYDLFKYNDVNLVKLRTNETVRHMWNNRKDNEIGFITGVYDDNIYAQIIHHVHVAPKLLDSMIKYCPNDNPEILKYVPRLRIEKKDEDEDIQIPV